MATFQTSLEIGELTREDGGPSMWQVRVVFMPFATEQQATDFIGKVANRMVEWPEITLQKVEVQ